MFTEVPDALPWLHVEMSIATLLLTVSARSHTSSLPPCSVMVLLNVPLVLEIGPTFHCWLGCPAGVRVNWRLEQAGQRCAVAV
jgi:hypothetical protein